MRDYGGLAARLPWMVTFFVITTLSVVGLPMLNGFVGEFLVFTGTMQSVVNHHVLWTVIATTGVILTASYMLWMVQRVFYGDLNPNTAEITAPDVTAREHIALWPLVALMLVMGIASPYWMRAIDPAGVSLAEEPLPAAQTEHSANLPGPIPGRCISAGASRNLLLSQHAPTKEVR
jgi:NADH-quinone oxidoreductase subunit M